MALSLLSDDDLDAATREVVGYLYENRDRWVPGMELVQSPVGGTQWDRRLRDARTAGFPVENRPPEGRRGPWDWRWVGGDSPRISGN